MQKNILIIGYGDIAKRLIKVLDKQSPTLRKLDLSGNLIKDDLVNALAYTSNLRLT